MNISISGGRQFASKNQILGRKGLKGCCQNPANLVGFFLEKLLYY